MNKKIEEFLQKKSELPKLLVIYWPTASGKTGLSIEIAKQFNSEIIWADSRQIYKYLDIWTGKITEEEKEGIPHNMIDIINPDENYSVWEYKKQVIPLIEEINSRWKLPILCWGTWLYIDSIIYNFSVPEIEPNWELRKELEQIRLERWNEYLWNILNEIDPEYASELHPNNYRYVERAIEVKKTTGKSKKELKAKENKIFDYLLISPDYSDRERLYNKINSRIDEMFNWWLIDEVKYILNLWYKKDCFWLNTIGYKEIVGYLNSEITLDEAINLVKQHNRNYAKRQITWFNKYNN